MSHRSVRVLTIFLVVATLAALMAGGMEFVRLRRLAAKYRYIAWAVGNDVQSHLGNLTRAEDRLRRLRAKDESGTPLSEDERLELIELPIAVEFGQARVAASVNLLQLYEHAADHPWEHEPVHVAPHYPGLRDLPIVRRLVESPPASPPVQPEFVPRPDDSPPMPAPPPPAPRPRPTALLTDPTGAGDRDETPS